MAVFRYNNDSLLSGSVQGLQIGSSSTAISRQSQSTYNDSQQPQQQRHERLTAATDSSRRQQIQAQGNRQQPQQRQRGKLHG